MSFIFKFLQETGNKLLDSFQTALVNFDPETATEAQIAELADQLDKVSLELSRARADYRKEQDEADAIVKNFISLQEAAKKLLDMANAEGVTPERKTELETKVEALTKKLEGMLPDVEREKEEARVAKEFRDVMEQATLAAAEALKTARSLLNQASREAAIAEKQKELALRRENAVKAAAGINASKDGANVVMNAFAKRTSEAKAAADAANTRAELLKPAPELTEDADIAAALASVKGEGEKPTDLAGRLAALRV